MNGGDGDGERGEERGERREWRVGCGLWFGDDDDDDDDE